MELAVCGEEVRSLVNGHGEDVSNRAAIVANLEGGRIVALAVAGVAVSPRGREKVHLQLDAPVALALWALSAGVVEREARSIKASQAGLGDLSKELADVVEDLDVCSRAGS